MKFFESALIFSAIQAIANGQQFADYFPTSVNYDFEMDPYEEYPREQYYYDSYTPY